MTQQQMTLALDMPASTFFPTAAGLRAGDVLEGYSDKAFPRPLSIVGVKDLDGEIQIIFTETVAGEKQYGTVTLPSDVNVCLQPPF